MENKPLFLVIEGADGVGKSTLAKSLVKELNRKKIDVLLVSKGYTDIDQIIEKLKLGCNYDCQAHFFLALANSIMTYNEAVKNMSNKKNAVIIFDRYYYTTIAYNVSLGLDEEWCYNTVANIPKPNKVIYCELGIEQVLKRKKRYEAIERGFSSNKNLEEAFKQYQSKVVKAYDNIIADDPSLFLKVTTDGSKKAEQKVLNYIYEYLKKREEGLEVKKLSQYLQQITITKKGDEIGTYNSPVLVCIDAVLSINRQYYKFVVPRIKYFMDNHPEIITLKQLKVILEEEGAQGFSHYWNYNHVQRYETLYRLVEKFLEIQQKYNAETELASLRLWSQSINVKDFSEFNVKGIGIATFQYLRLMLGASTVKPDVHIKKAIFTAIGRKVNDIDAIILFEEACKTLCVPTKAMDHELWLSMAKDVNKEYEWVNNRWEKK